MKTHERMELLCLMEEVVNWYGNLLMEVKQIQTIMSKAQHPLRCVRSMHSMLHIHPTPWKVHKRRTTNLHGM